MNGRKKKMKQNNSIEELETLVEQSWDKQKLTKTDYILWAFLGLIGEIGELADNLKRELYYKQAPKDKNYLEESGDILHYFSALLKLKGYSFKDAATNQLEKFKKRFPNGWNQEDAILKRDHHE